MRSAVHRFDSYFALLIARLPRWLRPLMRLASVIGHPFVTIGFPTSIAAFALWQDDFRLGLLCAVAVLTVTTSSLMKLSLRRQRPISDYIHTMGIRTFSFPSGHSAGSVVSFGLFAYLVGNSYPSLLPALAIGATGVSVVVGISRVYLGAHYPSDVLGGWLVGAAGVLVIIAVGS